ncbi:hypothetical protein PTTG_25206 [Puccinia triticina 1-1 BBBD Race 1]|uniref:Uncharacterized protein n=1 Tax=Puccinia triticina (isolate 1-1 / race 1 (BBBD)) TaxID=630390 RepID=A0A180H742_PUCT1|nr:hypothetical protein PTTG_25206 [Puccinia triticina 1-1 BBBD Race 1]
MKMDPGQSRWITFPGLPPNVTLGFSIISQALSAVDPRPPTSVPANASTCPSLEPIPWEPLAPVNSDAPRTSSPTAHAQARYVPRVSTGDGTKAAQVWPSRPWPLGNGPPQPSLRSPSWTIIRPCSSPRRRPPLSRLRRCPAPAPLRTRWLQWRTSRIHPILFSPQLGRTDMSSFGIGPLNHPLFPIHDHLKSRHNC